IHQEQLDTGAFATASSPHLFSNVGPGPHTVTIKDGNNCSKNDNVTVQDAVGLALSLSQPAVSCVGAGDGTITATFSGGTGSYQVQLDTGAFTAASRPHLFSNVGPGPHTVTIKDGNNCSKNDNVTVQDAVGLALSLSQPAVSCVGAGDGTITATFSGGTGSYQVQLDTGAFTAASRPHLFSNVGPGPHTVTIKDGNNCSKNDNVTVQDAVGLALSLSQTAVSCVGAGDGTITATFSGGTGSYQGQLDTGGFTAASSPHLFSNVGPGPHTVTIKDGNNCSKN